MSEIFDNAKLTKLYNRLVKAPPLKAPVVEVIPDLITIDLVNSRNVPLPAGVITELHTYLTLAKGGDKQVARTIDISYKLNDQQTTKTIDVKVGETKVKVDIVLGESVVKFSQPADDVLTTSITVTFVPDKRVRVG